jgi:asparagine synthase (glutamine-hydrolysing)
MSGGHYTMKMFLATFQKQDNNFLILQQSEEIEVLDQKELLILYCGDQKNILNELLNNYKTKGIDFLKKLEGSFSCLVYDKIKNQLFIAKDQVGIQPLYFSSTENHIVISSHLKAFNKLENFEPIINPHAVGSYMQFGFILQPNTIFKNCYKVCSGEYISFDLSQDIYTSTKYWELESCYSKERTRESETEILKKSESLLQKAVEKSTQASQFGLSLSGGYDSSTLTAICQQQHQNKIDTFTIGFHDDAINEAQHAKAIAKHLGTNHTEYYFTDSDALELVPKICKIYDEPFADHASTPTILTSHLLKENKLSNLIAGDGGDEVFATAEDVYKLNLLDNIPMPLKKILVKVINYLNISNIPYLKNLNDLPHKQNKLLQLILANNIPQMIYSRNILFMDQELQMSIKNYTKAIETSFDSINFLEHTSTLDQVIGSYFKTTMVDGELMKSHASMNYEGIKISTPFLDIDLIQYMTQVPPSIKIKNHVKKYLLKEIAHQYIPKKLIDRPKSGFVVPFASWMRGILKDNLYIQINKKRLDKDNIFYTSSILKIRDQFYAGNNTYQYKLWRIFIFQLWYEDFTLSEKNNSNNKG